MSREKCNVDEENLGEYVQVKNFRNAFEEEKSVINFDVDKLWIILRIAFSEMIGTAILVGLGCGSTVALSGGNTSHLTTVLSFAFGTTLSVSAFAHLSGAFINPSLALTATVLGKLSIANFFIYTISQCIGAIVGTAAVKAITPSGAIGENFCVAMPDASLDDNKAVLAESLFTFCLCMVICSCLDNRNKHNSDSWSIKFGLTIIALGLVGGKYTGCSMNPARSFGPALLSGQWKSHWIYWIGPLTGAMFAGLTYRILFDENIPKEKFRKRKPIEQSE